MIQVKANAVKFELADGKIWSAPRSYGLIHDPEGKDLPRCDVYIGPYKVLRRKPPEAPRSAKRYFGTNHQHKAIEVDLPTGSWVPFATVKQIFYVRRGTRARGGFHHPFARSGLRIEKSGRFYRVSMGSGCIIDDRGFVFP